jgi:hypothetical protein
MSEQPKNEQKNEEKKPLTPAEIAKQLLARKKEAQARKQSNGHSFKGQDSQAGVPTMQNQNNKKPNNQRKRMGV